MAQVTGADQVLRRLQTFDQRYKATVQNVLTQQAALVQQRLKAERPWQDQTTNAREGLRAGVQFEGRGFVLRAYHTVSYGVFLEVGHQGRFAVLGPVLRTQWPTTKRAVAQAVKEIKAV